MGWNILFDPVLPWAVIAGLAAIGIILVGIMAYARSRGVLLRAASLALLVAALANPSVRNEQRQPLTDIAVAVIDRSMSQENGNRSEQTSKAEQALKEMAARLLMKGIYVIGFSFPVVPKGAARIRTQMSAAHSNADIDRAVTAFGEVGRELGIVS